MHRSAAFVNKWYTLDRTWIITGCDPSLPAHLSQSVGRTIWEASPGIEDKVRPLYERAWETGRADELVNFGDILADIHIVKRGEEIVVSFVYTTVNGLRDSLQRISEATAQRDSRQTTAKRPKVSARHLWAVCL